MRINALLDRPIAFHRIFRTITGSTVAALFLSQAWYWRDKGKDNQGWIYKTQAEWENETGLTRREQERARAELKTLGILHEKKEGIPCRLYFQLDQSRVWDLIEGLEPNGHQVVQIAHTGVADSAIQECAIPPYRSGRSVQTNTETTIQRIHTETTDKREDPEADFLSLGKANFVSFSQEPEINQEPSPEPFITVLPDQPTERRNVPVCDAPTNVAGLAKIRPADTLATQFACKSSASPDYARFKAIYEGFTFTIGANYGVKSKAAQVWQAIEDAGEIDDAFWDGLQAYIALKQRQFSKEGRAIGVKGAANWLLDREWHTALAQEAMHDAARSVGVDLSSPRSVKAGMLQAKNNQMFDAVFGAQSC
jgi:hypothetical protein